MSELRTLPTQQLFKQWRSGDGNAGQAMAQRFSDWYYAITASRLGDAHGRGPLQRACVRFQQGIVSVTNPNDLADWAHALLAEEILQAGGRISGGDFPNQLTGGKSPTEMLSRARKALPEAQTRLLAHLYDARYPFDEVTKEAEAMGGMPLAVLQARHQLKIWLRDNAGVAFTEIPEKPNLDCGPLPLYEGGRMPNLAEETGFEKWMLSDMNLCKDIAEFGVFSLALRHGAFSGGVLSSPVIVGPVGASPVSGPPSQAPSSEPRLSRPDARLERPGNAGALAPLLILVGVGAIVVLAIIAVVALKLLG